MTLNSRYWRKVDASLRLIANRTNQVIGSWVSDSTDGQDYIRNYADFNPFQQQASGINHEMRNLRLDSCWILHDIGVSLDRYRKLHET